MILSRKSVLVGLSDPLELLLASIEKKNSVFRDWELMKCFQPIKKEKKKGNKKTSFLVFLLWKESTTCTGFPRCMIQDQKQALIHCKTNFQMKRPVVISSNNLYIQSHISKTANIKTTNNENHLHLELN